MNKNVKLLDKFDKKENIYKLICELAERAHLIMSGASVSSDNKETDPVQLAMEEGLRIAGEKDE